MKFLLDTCTFLWLAADSPHLSARARVLFRDPANSIYLSVVSAWEICVKHGLGRLPLPQRPDVFVPAERQRHAIASLSLDEAASLELPSLPAAHRDPFDRMLVCQARAAGMVILTPDPLIAVYPVQTAW